MAKDLPDFSDTALFPTFATIPEEEEDDDNDDTAQSTTQQPKWYLLAQVKDDMTISKPTLVASDRDGNPFALTFDGFGRDDLDLKGLGFRKGRSFVVPGARRTQPLQGKRAFVRVRRRDAGAVRAVPGPLERVLGAGAARGGGGERCGGCGGSGGDLKGCTGCGRVGYCSKECQIKGWNEGGHKNDCKMFKALNDIFA